MAESEDCKKCKWNQECVNVNVFKDDDYLQYEANMKQKQLNDHKT